MTDNEKQRVAEWCGWRELPGSLHHGRRTYWVSPSGATSTNPPDYNSLDACAKFERVVKDRGLEDEYEHVIIAACGKPVGTRSYAASTFATTTATPAQRVEAILRVIEETRE